MNFVKKSGTVMPIRTKYLSVVGFLLLISLMFILLNKITVGFQEHMISVHLVVVGFLMGSGLLATGALSHIKGGHTKYAWKFFLLVCFQTIVSLLFIIFFKLSFPFKKHLIAVHLVMVGAMMGSVYLLMGALVRIRRFRQWRWSKYVLAMIQASIFLFLLVLYSADFSANKMGANNITYDVFWLYIFSLKDISQILPLSIHYIYLFIVILLVLFFAVYIKLSKVIFDGICELVLPGSPASLFLDKKRAVKSLIFLIMSSVVFIWFMGKYFNARNSQFWMGEPIANFLVYWSPLEVMNPHRVAVAEEDRRMRATYPPGIPFIKKSVVLIVADSLRADHMNVYGYKRQTTPFLSSMVDQGKLMKVKRAVSSCPETAAAVLSILASRNFRSLSEYNFKLNELLRDQGYKVYYIHSGDQTYYQHLRRFFGKEIDSYSDGNNSLKYSINDDRVIFEALGKIPDYKENPAFFYFHLMSTHFTGVRHAEYEKFKPSKMNAGWVKYLDNEYKQDVLVNRYDDGVLEADSIIKDIFETLRRKGYLPGSIVFILSDHGEGLGEHGTYGHNKNLHQEDIVIPMLIFDQERTSYANLEFASQIDVAPTILNRLGLPIPSSWEGRSLLDKNIKGFIYSRTRDEPILHSILYRDDGAIYHYIRGPMKEELYELTSDPGEHQNIIHTIDSSLLHLMREKAEKGFGLD